MNQVIIHGKHKDHTYEYVLLHDEGYCKWALNQVRLSNNLELFRKYIISNYTSLYPTIEHDIYSLRDMHHTNVTSLLPFLEIHPTISKIINMIEFTQIDSRIILYPSFIENNDRLYSLYGIFIEYIIRHYLLSKTNKEISDDRVIRFLNDRNIDHVIGQKDASQCRELISESYKIYCMNGDTKDVILHIWNIAIAHMLSYGQDRYDLLQYLNTEEIIIDNNLFSNICIFCNKLIKDYKNIDCNTVLNNDTLALNAESDLVCDNVLIELKVSKYPINTRRNIIQTLLYATLYQLKYNHKIKSIILYNPIGHMYIANTNTISFEEDIINIIKSFKIGTAYIGS